MKKSIVAEGFGTKVWSQPSFIDGASRTGAASASILHAMQAAVQSTDLQ